MQLGMIGLGRMGANIVRRCMRDGHQCVVYDVSEDSIKQLENEGATGASTLTEFVSALAKPRVAWVMIPAAITGSTVDELAGLMEAGDIIIDGGNSNYRDDIHRQEGLRPKGIHYIDIGTSGGVFGLERGYCLMIGGDEEAVTHLDPLLKTIAPGVGTAARTPGREGEPTTAEQGYLHCGPSGAGHFVKMVHNGIEYGIMGAFAEGMNVLKNADVGLATHEASAEIAPVDQPQYYQYEIDVASVAEVWRRGSVVASWLLDLTAASLVADPNLEKLGGRVSDSGEGRWTIKAAIDEGVPVPVLSASLYERFASRNADLYANKLLSAMRLQFGGHQELATGDQSELGRGQSDAVDKKH
jgi:6-phosphogluconate dehydrogenase